MNNDTMCRIPVTATYEIIDGKAVMTDAEWRDIPADVIARLLIAAFGGQIPGVETEAARA